MEIIGLNDNGIRLASTQAELTPIQRFVYALAKDHHEDTDVDGGPAGMKGAHGATRGF